ncbi:MAG: CHAT domain-containing protein, partial [Sphingobacteriaceae bacterium]|nr:CHAT domain-containing protein [Cytophagaceae bacterium]
MNTLLFAYANDRARPLPSLSEEDSGIDRLLDARASRNHFQKIRDSFATTDSVAAKLLTYQDSLCLFHFSGHAGGASLHLEDTEARGQGIAQLLGRCPNLRLVFLNGCSTLGHIQLLKAQGVRAAVLATSTPIEDALAARFALSFYRAMVNQYPVAQALDAARLELQVNAATDIQPIRGDMLDDALAEVSRNQWYFYASDEEATRWELPTGVDAVLQDYKPNAELRRAFFNALRAYDSSLTEQFKAKQTLPPEALKNWLNEEIMRRLPYPISEPLRKLFCPALSPEGKLLPVGCTRERLVNYVSLVESSVDLLVVVLLAQVFDRLIRARNEGTVLTPGPEETAQVQTLLVQGWSDLAPPALVRALKYLSRFLADSQTALFVTEMQELARQFDEKTSFYESVVFFDDLRCRLADPAGVGNIPSLCQVGEDHLVELCNRLGFWANYQLESYKNIRVVSFFHRLPAYKHERVVLRTSQSYRLDERYFQEVDLGELWESQS